ncbi:hypothetical protein GCM10027610_009950 [Dactylosporangium cerinum]
MPVFYDGHDVRITHRSFQVLEPVRASYAIGELRSVWVVIPGTDHLRVLVRMSCSGGSVAVAALFATGSNHAAGWVFAVLSLLVLATLWARPAPAGSPPDYQLVAAWQGTSICLYTTTDPVRFGQVRRALQRALDWTEDA